MKIWRDEQNVARNMLHGCGFKSLGIGAVPPGCGTKSQKLEKLKSR